VVATRPPAWKRLLTVIAAGSCAATVSACCKRPSAISGAASGAAEAQRGAVTQLAIANDQPAYFVRSTGKQKRLIAYLPPRCEEVVSTLEAWGPAASSLGVVVMLVGDQPCPGSSHRHFTADPALIERRLDAVVTELSRDLPGEVDATTVIVVGYSEGAARAEALVARSPSRFSRAVLIGAPDAPTANDLRHARAVATMAGDRDRRDLMMLGVQSLGAVHVPARFFLLPNASHGEMGPEGGKVMTEALQWLLTAAP
jgi:pimeloyl-ACP methyl ester carboxylesterase